MSSSQTPSTSPQSYLDENTGHRLTTTAIVFIVLDSIFVALRFWSRRLQRSPLGWDDYLILPGLLFCYGSCILALLAVQYGGVGHHVVAIHDPQTIVYWYKSCIIATPVIYCAAVAFPKLAILAVYLRIFVDRFSRITCYVVATIVLLTAIVTVPAAIWHCIPIAYGWDKSISGGRCSDTQALLRYATLPNIVTDVAMLIQPIPVIWKLHMLRTTKVGLVFTFLLGGIGLITSILRFTAFFATAAFVDGTYASVDLVTWCIVEPSVYLTAACLLAYRPLVIYVINETPLSNIHVLSKSRDQRTNSEYSDARNGTAVEQQAGRRQARIGSQSSDSDIRGLVHGYGKNTCNAEALTEQHSLHGKRVSGDGIHVEHGFMCSSDPAS